MDIVMVIAASVFRNEQYSDSKRIFEAKDAEKFGNALTDLLGLAEA